MKIVLVCTGNTCRSPMAEALLRLALSRRGLAAQYEVCSAGVYVAREGEPASARAVQAMAEMGLDIASHRARSLTRALAEGARVLCMTASNARAARRIAPGADVRLLTEYADLYGEIPDPFGGDLANYRHTARAIERAAERIAEKLS